MDLNELKKVRLKMKKKWRLSDIILSCKRIIMLLLSTNFGEEKR
jgi:hypothetical protein